MKVSINDINRRQRLMNNPTLQASVLYGESGIDISEISQWQSYSDNINECFNHAFDVMEDLVIEGKCNKRIAEYLAENVDKVRDVNQLQNSIKHRNSRLKTKISTKIQNKHASITDILKANIANLQNTLKLPTGGSSSQSDNPEAAEKESNEAVRTLESYYAIISEAVNRALECDRIVSNYSKISKVFNLDNMVLEIESYMDLYPTAYGIASCIDTSSNPFKNKYNCALETVYYVFNKHHIHYPEKLIAEAVTDYFLIDGGIGEAEVEDIKAVIDGNAVLNKDTFEDILIMQALASDSTSIDKVEWDQFTDEYGTIEESNIHPYVEDVLSESISDKLKGLRKANKQVKRDVKDTNKMVKNNLKNGNPDERANDDVKEMVAQFRDDCLKNEDKTKNIFSFKAMVSKIYAKSPEMIVEELPNLFVILRAGFVVGMAALNPILAAVAAITSYCLKMDLERKQCEKIKKAYDAEIEAVNRKIEKAKDEEMKDRYTRYKVELVKDAKKIHEYETSLYTDQENDERDVYSYNPGGEDEDLGDFDMDWGDDDEWDTDFDEGVIDISAAMVISELVSSLNEFVVDDDLDGMVSRTVFKMDNDSLDALADFVVTVPVVLEASSFKNALMEERANIRSKENKSGLDYVRIDCINENIYKLDNMPRTYNTTNNTKGIIAYLRFLNELAQKANSEYITEMNLTNNLKVAIKNLKRGAIKLSDQEKKLSNNIDVSVNNVSKGIETAMMNNNREAVIKGRIIPSASKTIKMALATGVAWAINPAIAVIGALGTFACMKKMQDKERQLVLDDIELELKMCERYINEAEDKKDFKKVRELEKIQRNLQRQKQRIKYKMNVEHDMNVPNATDKPEDIKIPHNATINN